MFTDGNLVFSVHASARAELEDVLLAVPDARPADVQFALVAFTGIPQHLDALASHAYGAVFLDAKFRRREPMTDLVKACRSIGVDLVLANLEEEDNDMFKDAYRDGVRVFMGPLLGPPVNIDWLRQHPDLRMPTVEQFVESLRP